MSIDRPLAEPGKEQLWNAIRSALISARKGVLIERVEREGVLPLSFVQQRFWVMEQLDPGTFINNLPTAFQFDGRLDVIALEQSFGELRRRHEILRTTFPVRAGKSMQSIDPDLSFTLPIIDLQSLPAADRIDAARREFTKLAQQPFDLGQGSLLRVQLVRLAPDVHQAIVVMHHLICDGLSIEIFWQELAAIYTALVAGKPSPLADLPIQYADFAIWQRQRLEGEILDFQLDYWQQQLSGSLPLLQLPIDRSRPPIQTTRGVYRRFELSPRLCAGLQSLSQRSGVTLFMTFLAAFQVLLHRYSGQEDIIIGTPISGRNRPEIEGSIGCFINTLVLRTNLADNPSFQAVLAQVQQVALGAYAHQDLPFEKLIEALNPPRDLSRSPLFQAMFIFEHISAQTWDLPGLTVNPVEVKRRGISVFDLSLNIKETATGIEGGIEYNTALFGAATIERTIGHFQTLLTGIVADPSQRILELPLLTVAERSIVLPIPDRQQTDDLQQLCIHHLFEAQVERTPHAIAVICGDEEITYQELNSRSNQLADRLYRIGVRADVLVGILMARSIDLVVGLLGILKAGGAYVPLDPSYPPDRLSYMVADAGVEILLTQPALLSILASPPSQVVCLDPDWQKVAVDSAENLDRDVSGHDLAYVIYTSGSTGKPKGVAIEHHSVVNLLQAARSNPGIEPEDVLAAITTIAFDIAVLELYLPLIVGAKVLLIPRDLTIDPDRLLAQLSHSQTTIIQGTPTTWRLLLAAGWSTNCPLKVWCGGEVLSIQLAQQILDTGSQLWNIYGPTEATVWSTIDRVNINRLLTNSNNSIVSIGKPFANTQTYILNPQLQPVPIGIAGELYLGGAGLARGYLHRPELTTAKFIADPHSGDPGARLYRTGDLARYRSDGRIEFLGRIDRQVKIRGFRIELGEIETVLSQHPLIRQAVIIATEIESDCRLLAYILPHQQPAPNRSELRSFLQAQLPEYMIPALFISIDSFPLTNNGKIDLLALPRPDTQNLTLTPTFIAPTDGLELQLTKIWERVLKIRPIGISDNFFNLGGHSLLAVELFAELEKTFDRHLPLATLFHAPTIDRLAQILRQASGSTTWSSLVPISARGSKPPLFCLHPVGGNILEYYPLVAHLGAEQPIYGLQSPGLDGVQTPLQRIEDMAAHYIRDIRTVQPQGPYLLLGYSFGALVAFEIACQLAAQGETIGLLALIDTAAPNLVRTRPPWWQTVGIHLHNLYQLSTIDRIQYLRDRIAFRLRSPHQKPTYRQYLLDRLGAPLPADYLQVLEINLQAARDYSGKFYHGEVTLFRSTVQLLDQALHRDLGWGKLVDGGIKIHDIQGQHSNLLKEPSIGFLAAKLKLEIESI